MEEKASIIEEILEVGNKIICGYKQRAPQHDDLCKMAQSKVKRLTEELTKHNEIFSQKFAQEYLLDLRNCLQKLEAFFERCSKKQNWLARIVKSDDLRQGFDSELHRLDTLLIEGNFTRNNPQQGKSKIETLGDYNIIETVGMGRFGVVYRAKKMNEDFAIKKNKELSDSEYYQSWIDMQKLDNDHIVKILHVERSSDMFIVMEFCEGGNLSQFVVGKHPLYKERLVFMQDMAAGVCYLHKNGITHGNLKPENVLLTYKSRFLCKIGDFGYVKAAKNDQLITLCASTAYMAPELREGNISEAIDTFALGMIFFATVNRITLKGTDKLAPAIPTSGGKELYLRDELHGKENALSKDDFIIKYSQKTPAIGSLIFSMVLQEASERPDVKAVVNTLEEVYPLAVKNMTLQPEESEYEKFISLTDSEVDLLTKELNKGVTSGDLEEVKFTMKGLTEKNRKFIVSRGFEETPPLVLAAKLGHTEIVSFFLDNCCAEIDQCGLYVDRDDNRHLSTPLWCAAVENKLEVIKILLQHGADIDKGSDSDSSPLRAACYDGHEDIIKYLVEQGADINKTNKHKTSPLFNSVWHPKICQFLLEKGASINLQDTWGRTPLHCSIREKKKESVNILLDHGADCFIEDEYGDDCLQTAALNGMEDVIYMICGCRNVTKERTFELLELVGCYYVDEKDNAAIGLKLWKSALQARHADPNNIIPKEIHRPKPVYSDCEEVTSVKDIERLQENKDEMYMQSLIIRERIMGSQNSDTIHYIRYRGAVYADQDDFQRCLTLWKYAFKLQQLNLRPLEEKRIDHLVSMCHVMIQWEDSSSPETPSSYEAGYEIFQLHLAEIVASGEKDWKTEEFKTLLKSLLHLAVILSNYKVKNLSFRQLMRSLVKLDIKLAKGLTILHLAVSYHTSKLDNYTTTILFPSKYITELLLELGSSVNGMNEEYKTALELLVEEFDDADEDEKLRAKEVAEILISKNGKIDCKNETEALTAKLQSIIS